MKDLSVKKNILQEIMDLMDQNEGEKLKSHPKLMAAKIEVAKPGDGAASLIDKLKEGSPSEESSETPAVEKSEGDSEISPEDLKKLLEHLGMTE